jgi:hypothetical protein
MLELIKNFFTEEECADALKEINLSQPLWKKCVDTDMYVLGNSFLRNQQTYCRFCNCGIIS